MFNEEPTPNAPGVLQRQQVQRLQDREWLTSHRMLRWPQPPLEQEPVYAEWNIRSQDALQQHQLEAGGTWRRLQWILSQPLWRSPKASGRGDLLLGFGVHAQFLRDHVHSLTLGGVRFPTADAEVEPRQTRQVVVAQKFFWNVREGERLYLGAGYVHKGEDSRNYDFGDSSGVDFGFLKAVSSDLQFHGGLIFMWRASDAFQEASLVNREDTVDLQLGVLLWQGVRLGLQWPLLTDSAYRQHEDRQPIGELGFRHRF